MYRLGIIRHTHERTLELCEKLVRKVCDRVELVNEVPFSKALEATYEIGSSESDWVLVLDADVLIKPDTFNFNLNNFTTPVVMTRCWDYYLGKDREAGVRFYRPDFMKANIKNINSSVVRPEANVILRNYSSSNVVTATHGEHQ